jgi:hypothetical protein
MSQSGRERLRSAAPYLVATAWLVLGWAFLVRGVDHPGVAYRPWAFRHHAYSDLLAMTGDRYLHGGRPLPYVEDRIEYPVLLGVALWAPSFLPGGQVVHFTASVFVLWLCLMASVAVLRRLPGASPWWLAATPALAYFGALNWDLLPIALLLGAVLAVERDRPGRAGALAALGVSAKLWPVALLPGAIAALASGRRWAGLLRAGAAFFLVTLVVNLPVALSAPGNWSWFWRFNGGRSAENSVWEVLGVTSPPLLNALASAILLAAVLAAALLAWRAAPASRWRAVRLGTALVLVAWVASNKVWSPQYALYAFAAGALVAGPRWLFLALAAVSIVDYHLAFEVRAERGVFWFFDGWYYAEELVRTAVYAAFAGWILLELLATRTERPGREVVAGREAT